MFKKDTNDKIFFQIYIVQASDNLQRLASNDMY